MTESSEAPSLSEPLDVVPNDQTVGDLTAGDATRPLGEANGFTDEPQEESGAAADELGTDADELGTDAASDDLAHLQDGELVTDQEQTFQTPDDLGGVGGGQPGGAG